MRLVLARAGAWVARLDRRPVLHRLILRAIPPAIQLRFDPGAAKDLEAKFELRVPHPSGGEPARFQIAIDDGRCEVHRGRAHDGVTVTVAAGDLVRLGSGALGWPELLSSGRLELSGNPFEALRFPTLFRLPAAAATPRP